MKTPTKPLARLIVVTGASRGLGQALVEEFIRLGHIVVGCARNKNTMDAMAQQFSPPHDFSVVDVADEPVVAKWAERVLAEIGVPSLLINNAATINENAKLWEISPEEFSNVIDVNVKGVFHVIRHLAPAMIERGAGVIVNFSSGWGRAVSPEVAPYCASKWAIEGMTRALAEELPPGMAATPVNPGIINTSMLQSCFGPGAASYPTAYEWARKAAPFLLSLGEHDNGEPTTVPL